MRVRVEGRFAEYPAGFSCNVSPRKVGDLVGNVNPFTGLPEENTPDLSDGEPIASATTDGEPQLVFLEDPCTAEKARQFTIAQMMVVTLLCGVTIVAVGRFGLLGTLVLFGVFVITTGALMRSSISRSTYQFANEIMWGVVMPIVCVVTDPIVFQGAVFNSGSESWLETVHSWAFAVYSLIAWQMLNLVAAWFVDGGHPLLRAWFAGTLLMGSVLAFTIGICMLPLTFIGLLAFLGVLGFTPFLTGYVFLVASKRNWQFGTGADPVRSRATSAHWVCAFVGILVSLFVPLAVWVSIQSS